MLGYGRVRAGGHVVGRRRPQCVVKLRRGLLETRRVIVNVTMRQYIRGIILRMLLRWGKLVRVRGAWSMVINTNSKVSKHGIATIPWSISCNIGGICEILILRTVLLHSFQFLIRLLYLFLEVSHLSLEYSRSLSLLEVQNRNIMFMRDACQRILSGRVFKEVTADVTQDMP